MIFWQVPLAAESVCPVPVGSSRLTGRVREPERWREVHFRSFMVKPDLQTPEAFKYCHLLGFLGTHRECGSGMPDDQPFELTEVCTRSRADHQER